MLSEENQRSPCGQLVAPNPPVDLWDQLVARLPEKAQSIARSTANTAAFAAARQRGWDARELLRFLTETIDEADNPPGYVAARLAQAARRDPISKRRAAAEEVVSAPRVDAPARRGPCVGNGLDTDGCGTNTSTRTRGGRFCCCRCL
jgi:hypothetical protein